MIRTPSYFSVNRARWHHIDFKTVHDIRMQQANENTSPNGSTVKTEPKAKQSTKKPLQ